MPRLSPGDAAPKFSLTNQDGTKVTLASLKGQRVVLYFYPADDTPGCTKEACQFNDDLSGFNDLGVVVLGVSPDDAASHQKFRAKYGLRFDLLSDPTREVMASYGAYGEKMMYGKKVTGVIRSTFLISKSGRVEQAWYGVRADGHAAKVLASLNA